MRKIRLLSLCAIALVAADYASAANFSDPTWPCIQRKVPRLSMGLMWANPVNTEDYLPAAEGPAKELAATLALRRVSLEEAEALVQAFAEQNGHDPKLLEYVFAQVFSTLEKRRARIITGIAEVSQSQIDRAARIDGIRAEMDGIMAQDDPDFDRVDTLEEQLDWDERIYVDRQKSVTYLCETPVLLEKRLFALAQILQAAAVRN